MHVFDLADEQGRPRAFEIETTSISREGVIKVLKTIPGLVVTKSRAWYAWGESFCDFEVAGSGFQAREDPNLGERYWIGPSAPGDSPHLEKVKAAFLQHPVARWMPPLRILSVAAIGGGALMFGMFSLLGPSNTTNTLLAIASGGVFLAGAVLLSRITTLMRDGKGA